MLNIYPELPHKPIRAVIFDMDGTIIDSESIWHTATMNLLKERGITTLQPHQLALLESFSGCGLEYAAAKLKAEFNFQDSLETLMKDTAHHAAQEFDADLPLIGGFKEFHAFLREHNLKSGIATNADLASFGRICKKLEFENYFGTHLYCVDHVGGLAKPHPKLFLHAAEQLGVPPEECLVFEDSIFGFKAAQAAGMRCVGIKNNINQKYTEYVSQFIDNYTQAHDIIKNLLGITPTAEEQPKAPAQSEQESVA